MNPLVAAALNMSAAVPVKQEGLTWGAIGIYLLLAVLVPLAVYIIKTTIAMRPALIKLANERSSSVEAARLEDVVDMRSRLKVAEDKADSAVAACHKMEMQLTPLVTCVQLVLPELERLDPFNPVLKQARELLQMVVTGDFGIHKAMIGVASIPATQGNPQRGRANPAPDA